MTVADHALAGCTASPRPTPRHISPASRALCLRRPLLALAFLLAVASPALGHGGDDHGEAEAVTTSPAGEAERSHAVRASALELVLRWPARPKNEPLTVRALLSRLDDNAPLENATVTLDVTEPDDTSLPSISLAATSSPGIYEGQLTARSEGHHAAVITVVAGELIEAFTVPTFMLGPPPPPPPDVHDHGPPLGFVVAATAMAFVIVLLSLALLRRSRRRREQATVVTGLAALFVVTALPGAGLAHGGEDHGAAAAIAASGPMSADTVFLRKESQFLLGIRTTPVGLAPFADRLEVPGTITAPSERQAAVFAPQQGRVLSEQPIPLLGAEVKKGQVLAVLEAALTVGERASFSVEGARSRSEVQAAQANLAAAEKNAARISGLGGVVSEREKEQAAVAVEEAAAALAAAQAKQQAYGSTARSTRMVLTAPLDGVIADVDISPGELVDPARRAFLIVDPSELWVEAKVFEADLGRLSAESAPAGDDDASASEGTAPTMGGAMVSVDAYPNTRFPATLLALGEVVDPQTRTVKAVFRVDNVGGKLKLGMFAHVAIGTGAPRPVVVVPESALLDVDGRHVAFVHTAPEEFTRREVAVGRSDGGQTEVRAGLAPGERVVTSGLLTLKNAPPAPAAKAPAAPATSAAGE